MKRQRWTRRKDARAPEILEAALACFSEKGFAATRMEEIAERAAVSKGTIYLYFKSKEAVFEALVRRAVGVRIADATDQVDAFEGPTPDLLRMVLRKVGPVISAGDQPLPRIVLAEAGNFPELAEYWRREVVDRGLGLWEAIIRRGLARGEFRDVDPSHVARLCVAPFIVASLWRSVLERSDPVPCDYQGLIDSHIDILLRGLAAEDKT